ncbi:MAG: isoprenyl transferase [Magnetococcales bacterium]|nr:isoprenyl transferase [Magnetococcales bacterium]NGZ06762.1 isoprenyl transferase [Magnetococcales bacterium]
MAMSRIPPEKMPRHIAIVMDGNRRWAKARLLPKIEGHRRGVKAVRRTVEACLELKIPTLTLYTFSSENWNRPQEEVSSLMNLLAIHLRKEMDELIEEGVRFRALGRIHELPENIQFLVRDLEAKTQSNHALDFNIALNYGGRLELVDAARALARDVAAGRLDPEAISEELLASRLTTAGQADPDLLIRTGGEQRISNFLLWQMAYTEMVFLPIFWPEFDASHLEQAIQEYAGRDRRFGAAR